MVFLTQGLFLSYKLYRFTLHCCIVLHITRNIKPMQHGYIIWFVLCPRRVKYTIPLPSFK